MRKVHLAIFGSLASSGIAFGADQNLEGVCKAIQKMADISPIGVKILAIITLIVLISVAIFTFIDRDKGGGKMSIVIGIAGLAGFAILWNLSDTTRNIILGLKSIFEC